MRKSASVSFQSWTSPTTSSSPPTASGASVTQLPGQYPLTTLFYKELIGCKAEDVQYCYRVAQPGTYTGRLGYELEAVYQSNPNIFGIEFNSQFAEEAFTVLRPSQSNGLQKNG